MKQYKRREARKAFKLMKTENRNATGLRLPNLRRDFT